MEETAVKKVVREGYARIAAGGNSCCAPATSCCGTTRPQDVSRQVGYSEADLQAAPEGANLGLGCGNPVALATLSEGETVLDLGSGAGFDCFLAANRVGKTGRVIGVDMTPEMVARAQENARKGRYANVEFKLGDIESLPVADGSVDVVISNCVINLSPDKAQVFREAYRVLKPGGRLMVSDIVLLKELPAAVKRSAEAYVGCLSGAVMKDRYLEAIESAGFRQVSVQDETSFPVEFMASDPTARAVLDDLRITMEQLKGLATSAVSIKVRGVKAD